MQLAQLDSDMKRAILQRPAQLELIQLKTYDTEDGCLIGTMALKVNGNGKTHPSPPILEGFVDGHDGDGEDDGGQQHPTCTSKLTIIKLIDVISSSLETWQPITDLNGPDWIVVRTHFRLFERRHWEGEYELQTTIKVKYYHHSIHRDWVS